jgi:hypothetical protein
VVKCGVLQTDFWASKNAPWFLSLFFGVPVLGMRGRLMQICAGEAECEDRPSFLLDRPERFELRLNAHILESRYGRPRLE